MVNRHGLWWVMVVMAARVLCLFGKLKVFGKSREVCVSKVPEKMSNHPAYYIPLIYSYKE